MAILIFFLAHWFLSLFCQTFFLHRYSSHKMFTMNTFWDRFFYAFTIISQGASFLNPRAYAIMHRMHHAFSDTEKDPHSPHFFKDVWQMTMHTKDIYINYAKYKTEPGMENHGLDCKYVGGTHIVCDRLFFVLLAFCHCLVDVFVVANTFFYGAYTWGYCKLVWP